MKTSRNPAKSRPLSANVKRLMRLARASPQNSQVIKVARTFTARDYAYCHKQGSLFMEAASMGFSMEDFAPLYMTSQLAGVFDVSFAAANGMENDELSNLLRIPMLLNTGDDCRSSVLDRRHHLKSRRRAKQKPASVAGV